MDRGDRFNEVLNILEESGIKYVIVDNPNFTTAVNPKKPEKGNNNLCVYSRRFVGENAFNNMRDEIKTSVKFGAKRIFLYRAWYDAEGPGTIAVRWLITI